MEELRKVQRDYGAAFANVLTLAKQRGLDCRTVERLLHALTLDGQAVPNDADHMQAALQRAALAFRHLVDAVHRAGVTVIASAVTHEASDLPRIAADLVCLKGSIDQPPLEG